MKIDYKYNGLILGSIFTIVSFLLTFTIIVPLLSVFPAAYLEMIVAFFFDNNPYSNIGKITILALILILIGSLVLFLVKSRKQQKSNLQVFKFLLFEFFVIHPLGFYLLWAIKLDFRSDGQLIFEAYTSFPYSSLGFVLLGVLYDVVKVNPTKTQLEN